MRIKTTRLNVLSFAIGLGASAPSLAGYFDADCHALKLKDASGVAQSKQRSYSFAGTCNINYVYSSGPSVRKTVPAIATAAWDASKFEFRESFNLLASSHIGDVKDGNTYINGFDIGTGIVSSVFKCNDDPLVTSAACGTISHDNQSGYKPFSNPALKQSRPLLKGKTTLAEATAFSKKHVNVNPVADATWPTAPPPTPTAKFGSGPAPTVAATPGNEPTLPPGAVRKSGGFAPGSGTNVQSVQPIPGSKDAIKGEVRGSSKVPAVQVNPGAQSSKAAIKGEVRGSAKVPAVQQGLEAKGGGKAHSQVPAVQVSPGAQSSKAAIKGEVRGSAKVPAVQQGLEAKGGGKAHSQVPAVQTK